MMSLNEIELAVIMHDKTFTKTPYSDEASRARVLSIAFMLNSTSSRGHRIYMRRVLNKPSFANNLSKFQQFHLLETLQ